MSLLSKPKLVAIDSSQYIDLIKDLNSSEGPRIRRSKDFQEDLHERGYVPLISFHHIAELLKHQDSTVVRDSVIFIKNLPAIAWVSDFEDRMKVGSVLDVLAAETTVAYENPQFNSLMVKQAASQRLLHFGTGEHAIKPFLGEWQQLQPHLLQSDKRQKEVMAISGSKYLNYRKTKIDKFANFQINSPEESARFLKQMKMKLNDDVKRSGDKAISDTDFIDEFLDDIRMQGEKLGQSGGNPLLALLKSFGVNPANIPAKLRLSEIGDLAAFFRQLEIVAPKIGTELDALKRNVRLENIPSWIIPHTMRTSRDPSLRRSGSELVDRHLVCLAAYADITFVDKRIKDNVQRARNISDTFSTLVHKIEKVPHYSEIHRHLD